MSTAVWRLDVDSIAAAAAVSFTLHRRVSCEHLCLSQLSVCEIQQLHASAIDIDNMNLCQRIVLCVVIISAVTGTNNTFRRSFYYKKRKVKWGYITVRSKAQLKLAHLITIIT